jgi:hypothetical protein
VLFHTPYFNRHEGGLNLLTIDDARPVDAWSHYHADYCVTELRLSGAREEAIAWALADVRARGLAAQAAAYEAQLAEVRAHRAALFAQRDRLEAHRLRDPRAPKVSPFADVAGPDAR